MSTFVVTTSADIVNAADDFISLREAVALANAAADADRIAFASELAGETVALTRGQITVTQDLAIDGGPTGAAGIVTLSAGDRSRVLDIAGSGTDVDIRRIALADGHVEDENGATVRLGGGSLVLRDCIIRDGFAGEGAGGGIYAQDGSSLVLLGGSLSDNEAYRTSGGAIATGTQVSLRVQGTNFVDNDARGIDNNYYVGGAIRLGRDGALVMADATVTGSSGGGIYAEQGGTLTVSRSTFSSNTAKDGGALHVVDCRLTIEDSTIVGNSAVGDARPEVGSAGGGLWVSGALTIRNSTITGNHADLRGGGIMLSGTLDIANTVVAGNSAAAGAGATGADLPGSIDVSNGHNVFGSSVAGNVAGDRENVAAAELFASLDPLTGGGSANASGIVLLRGSPANPALSGGDPLAASATSQSGTVRPLPAGSLPDIGAAESSQAPSTTASANNDVLTGTSSANTIRALGGADYLKGLAGNDTLYGGDQGDVLDGGLGNDKLYGDSGIDLVVYTGSTKVTVDLSLATDKATRGTEVDTLYNIEGAIGSNGADTFKGSDYSNFFQGGRGRDTSTSGGGRDTYDFNATTESGITSTTRDLIRDFAVGADKLDLMGIDADTTLAGNQAFRWVGSAALSGPGELGWFTSGGDTIVRASTDADSTSEFQIELTGLKALTALDFFL